MYRIYHLKARLPRKQKKSLSTQVLKLNRILGYKIKRRDHLLNMYPRYMHILFGLPCYYLSPFFNSKFYGK